MSASPSMPDELPACRVRGLMSACVPGTSTGTLRIIVAVCAIFAIVSFSRVNPAWWDVLPAAHVLHEAVGSEGLLLAQALIVTLLAAVVVLGVGAWRTPAQSPQRNPADATPLRTVVAMVVVWATALVAPPSRALVTGQSQGEDQILVGGTPLYLGEEVARRGIAGNMAAPSDWAAWLDWKSQGRLHRPSAGDREAILRGERTFDLLATHDIHYLAASRQRHAQFVRLATAEARAPHPRLRIIYQDQKCILVEVVKPRTGG